MSLRRWIGLVVAWIVSLVVVQVLGHAQVPFRPPFVQLPVPILVSGADVGFRVEGRRGNTPVGRFVIRSTANGQWIEPDLAGDDLKRLTAR
jgi:hypothetical protein